MKDGAHPEPLRIAYVTASLDLGGSERQMVNLATRLPRDRFAPEFVLLTGRGPLADLAEAANIPIHTLGWHRGDVPLRRVRRVGDVARYVALMRRRRFHVIDAWLFHAYALASATRDLTATPVVIAGRRSLSDFKDGFNGFNRVLDGLARRRVDAIVANGDAVRRDVLLRERLVPDRVDVIHNGITPALDLSAETRADLRSSWGFTPEHVVVGTVANYKAGKGLEAIIDIAARARQDVPSLRFVLVGEGPHRQVLKTMIADRDLSRHVILHGHAADARPLYGAFDIGLQASISEGLPNAVLEASAAGLPIVATDAGSTAEIVLDGVTGFVVPVNDESAMLDRLGQLAISPELRAALGAAGRERTAAVFGMDRFVAETVALYERVWARQGGRR